MGARVPLRRTLSRFKDRLLHKLSRIPQQPIGEPLVEARAAHAARTGVDSASTSANGHAHANGLGALPVEDLLERISELEATYHLNIKLWGYPQLRKSRYWDRRKIWVVIDQMGQAEEALSYHCRQAESAFRALSARGPPSPRSLFHGASLQLPGAYPNSFTGEGPRELPADPTTQPRAAATKFLTAYYVSLSDMRDNLKHWRAELKIVADQV